MTQRKKIKHKIYLQLGGTSRLEHLAIMPEALGSVLNTAEKVSF